MIGYAPSVRFRVGVNPGGGRLLQPGMITIGLATVIITMAAFFRVPILPDIGQDLSMSVSDLGTFTAVFAVGRLAVDIPAGRLADRIRPGRMMAAAAFVVSLGSLMLAAAPGRTVAYVGSLLLGIGSALTNTTGMTYFSTATGLDRRGVSMSIGSAGLLVGQAIGPTVAGLVALAGGWRMTEVVAAIIACTLAGVLVRWGTVSLPAHRSGGFVPGREGSSPSDSKRGIPSAYRAVLYLVPFVTFASLGSMTQTLIPVIGDEDLGLSAGSIGLALGMGGVARLVSSIVAGQVSDRVSRKSALVPGMLAQGAGIALLAAGPSLSLWLIAIVIIGLGSLGVAVSGTMLADLSRGSGVGRQFGPFRFVGDIGLITGPPIVAWLFENHGTVAAVLPLAMVVVAVGLGVALLVPETRWLEDDDPAQA